MNRHQRRAEARKNNGNSVVTVLTTAPWYVRGPARMMVAIGALCSLVGILYVVAELFS